MALPRPLHRRDPCRRSMRAGGRGTPPRPLCHPWHMQRARVGLLRGRSRGRRLAILRVEHDLTRQPPHAVHTRFELAVQRMIDAWITAGRLEVSPADLKLAREFLEQAGLKVEDAPDARVRIVDRQGEVREMSREGAVMAALRRLTRK